MNRILGCLLAFFIYAPINAQDIRCGTMEHLHQLLLKDPSLKSRLEKKEAERQLRLNDAERKLNSVVVVPVVFHIVYSAAYQNVTNDRILGQLDVLNNDYARLNQDAQSTPSVFMNVASGTQIQFCLARRDPNNKPTTGIERRKTTITSFDFDDVKSQSLGGLNAWNNAAYLNIWVCNLADNLLGYGTLPGSATPALDGVVVSYTTLGGPDAVGTNATYNLGRTLTHEVGHYFNLLHVWGDDGTACTGSDSVNDTPNQADENYGFPIFPSISCTNGPNGDMFMNFLDYSDDLAMNSFSAGQAARMEDALTMDRTSLTTSAGCIPPTGTVSTDGTIVEVLHASDIYCARNFSPAVVLKNSGTATLSAFVVKFAVDDSSFQSKSWTGSLTAGLTDTLLLDTLIASGGVHTFTVQLLIPGDQDSTDNWFVSRFTVMTSGLSLPFTQDFESKRFPDDSCRITNSSNDAGTWMRSRMASTKGNSSMWIYSPLATPSGSYDDYTLPPLNLTSVSDPLLAFDVAYAHQEAQPGVHELKILASVDCGQTFSEVYSKSGSALSTTTNLSLPFIPTEAEWRKDTLNLAGFAMSNNLILKFRSISGNENGLFIDNINIARFSDIFPDASGINFSQIGSINDGVLRFRVKLLKENSCNISVYNLLGQRVIDEDYSRSAIEYPSHNEGKKIPYLHTGVYIVQVITPSEKKSFKLFFRAR